MPKESKQVAEWKIKVREAFDERAKLYKDSDFVEFEKFMSNTHARYDKVLSVNIISTMIRRLIAQIYYRNPHVVVKALDESGRQKAPIISRLWNTKMRQLGLKKQVRMEIQDALSCGWGLMKLGYDSEFAVDPAAKYVSEAQEALDYMGQGTKPNEFNRIAPGSPYWLRIHPADVAFQPGRRDVESCRWGVQKYARELSMLKKDNLFSGTRDLKPDILLSKSTAAADVAYGISDNVRQEGIILLYEIHDLHEGKMKVCAANQPSAWLYDEDDEICRLTGRLPFYPLIFRPLSQSPYGCSSIHLAQELQKELNDIRTQDMEQRRISLLKFLVRKGFLSEEEKENFLSEVVGPLVEVNGTTTDDNIRPFQAHQGMDMHIAAENVYRDLREVMALGRVQMGEVAGGRKTAFEIAKVQEAFDTMTADYRSIVAEHILDLISDAHRIVAGTPSLDGFWTDERWIDVFDDMGRRVNVPFKGVDLKGDYDFNIDIESAPPLDTQAIQSERVLVFQALANNPRINQNYLLNWASEVFEGLDPQQLIVPEKTFVEAQKMTMQSQAEMVMAEQQMGQQVEGARRQDERDTKLAVETVKAAANPPAQPKSKT